MNAIQHNVFLWLAAMGLLAILAVLPTLIALARGADDIGYIILVNVICCATVFGWPIALIAAIAWPRRNPQPRRTPYQRPPAPPLHHHYRSRPHQRGPHA